MIFLDTDNIVNNLVVVDEVHIAWIKNKTQVLGKVEIVPKKSNRKDHLLEELLSIHFAYAFGLELRNSLEEYEHSCPGKKTMVYKENIDNLILHKAPK